MRYLFFVLGLGLFLSILFSNCSKEVFETGNVTLDFSKDTLQFDTVFTQVGSATRSFKIYNTLSKSVKISKIYMEAGNDTKFNINVDGIPGGVVRNVEIGPNDSIYVFAEVTIDPDLPLSESPFVLQENLIIETNGRTQSVVLEAWGQNANYIPSKDGAGGGVLFACNMGTETWDDPRPYVIYGILLIEDCTLKLPPGTHVYVHGGVALNTQDTLVYSDGLILVGENGRLSMEGTPDNPVVIKGDRLEEEFMDVAGQWSGIRYLTGSLPSSISHTELSEAIVAIRVDSAAQVTLNKVSIRNTSSSAIIGVGGKIKATNCLLADNGGYGLQLEYGGDYEFDYCTVANYGNQASAIKISNTICLKADCSVYIDNSMKVVIRNSILYGSQKDEVELFDWTGSAAFDYQMTNCLVKVKELTKENFYPDFFEHCNPCINGEVSDNVFKEVDEQDYQLDTLSIAEKQAAPIPSIMDDIIGSMRDSEFPDIGCYEFLY